ncbi:hypothetical protein AAHA92_06026 [Salvia divinorum]|uniref:Uncharacterized protein n=1 Tax=Salvia divinorum TaxID=28513 RepID=A0ABD1I7I1_SALDI
MSSISLSRRLIRQPRRSTASVVVCRCAGYEGMEGAMLQGVERQQDIVDHSPAVKIGPLVEIWKWVSRKWWPEMRRRHYRQMERK